MSMLQNVRAFLGLSPEDGETDGFHFGAEDDHTDGIYFESDELEDNTEERAAYERHEYDDADASVEITFEDESQELTLAEHQRQDRKRQQEQRAALRHEGERQRTERQRSDRDRSDKPRSVTNGARRNGAGSAPRSRPSRVNPEPAMQLQEARPKIVKPRSFDDAQTVADGFTAEIPIVMNLTDVDQELARRLIDFASGFCYVTGGEMERIRSRVFLLTPAAASLTSEDRRLLASRRYDR